MLAVGSSRATSSVTSSLRRQSFHAVPPSPLTRPAPHTPAVAAACPAAVSTSPTVAARSLSPLVGGHGTQTTAGISNLCQSYSPACRAPGLSRSSLSAVEANLSVTRRRSATPDLLTVEQDHTT